MIAGEQTISVAELLMRSSRLARVLAERGVGPEVLVGLCAERSVEMLVGLLAILEAGGAYVPLDPSYPTDRLRMMVADAGAPAVLAQPGLRDRLGDLDPVEIVDLLPDAGTAGPAFDRPRHRPGRSGVHHLHLGIHRPAEGGDDQPSVDRQPPALAAGRLPRCAPRTGCCRRRRSPSTPRSGSCSGR